MSDSNSCLLCSTFLCQNKIILILCFLPLGGRSELFGG